MLFSVFCIDYCKASAEYYCKNSHWSIIYNKMIQALVLPKEDKQTDEFSALCSHYLWLKVDKPALVNTGTCRANNRPISMSHLIFTPADSITFSDQMRENSSLAPALVEHYEGLTPLHTLNCLNRFPAGSVDHRVTSQRFKHARVWYRANCESDQWQRSVCYVIDSYYSSYAANKFYA